LAWLGITLQHPPVTIDARPAPALTITGARADLAYAQALRVQQHLSLRLAAELEIEYAIPRGMGLSSEAMLGLTVARTLAVLAEHPAAADSAALAEAAGLTPSDSLARWGFESGGFLLTGAEAAPGMWPTRLRRYELAHADDRSWAWVQHLPQPPDGASPGLEAEQAAALLRAAPLLSPETGRLVDEALWPALEHDDMEAFGATLNALQDLNRQALEQAGTVPALLADTAGVLDVLRDNGAAAWGQSATGLARFALIRGAQPSIDLRRALGRHLSYESGTIMASICDNTGARHTVSAD
jgi:predicted sugar kinase